jgi:hypothetical protein
MVATKTIVVQCTYTLSVEVPADLEDEALRFHIEENGCPATGFVGDAFYSNCKKREEEGMCWHAR